MMILIRFSPVWYYFFFYYYLFIFMVIIALCGKVIIMIKVMIIMMMMIKKSLMVCSFFSWIVKCWLFGKEWKKRITIESNVVVIIIHVTMLLWIMSMKTRPVNNNNKRMTEFLFNYSVLNRRKKGRFNCKKKNLKRYCYKPAQNWQCWMTKWDQCPLMYVNIGCMLYCHFYLY